MSDRSWNAQRSRRAAARQSHVNALDEKIPLTLHLHRATPRAVLVSDDENEESAVWLPLGEIDVDENAEEGDSVEVRVPEWLAREKGLV